MNGYVSGRQPRIGVVFLLPNQPRIEIEFVIDTGFEGALTLPAQAVAALNLPLYQNIDAYLADDSSRKVDMYTAAILWQGRTLNVAVLAMGQRPLLGTALLDGNDLHVHFDDGGPLSVTPF
jgi:clan AA aspartic protease